MIHFKPALWAHMYFFIMRKMSFFKRYYHAGEKIVKNVFFPLSKCCISRENRSSVLLAEGQLSQHDF